MVTEIDRCSCGCQEVHELRRRVAALEAENDDLRAKTHPWIDSLGPDVEQSSEFDRLAEAKRAVAAAAEGDPYIIAAVDNESRRRLATSVLFAVSREARALLDTTCCEAEASAFAQHLVPHRCIPRLVSEHVVAPFVEPDDVVVDPAVSVAFVVGSSAIGERAARGMRALIDRSRFHGNVHSVCATSENLVRLVALARDPFCFKVATEVLRSALSDRTEVFTTAEFRDHFFVPMAAFARTADLVEALTTVFLLMVERNTDEEDVLYVKPEFCEFFFARLANSAVTPAAVLSLSTALWTVSLGAPNLSALRTASFRDDFFIPLARHATTLPAANKLLDVLQVATDELTPGCSVFGTESFRDRFFIVLADNMSNRFGAPDFALVVASVVSNATQEELLVYATEQLCRSVLIPLATLSTASRYTAVALHRTLRLIAFATDPQKCAGAPRLLPVFETPAVRSSDLWPLLRV